jgi:hypothetical protein
MGVDGGYGNSTKKPTSVASSASRRSRAASASLRARNARVVGPVYGPIINPNNRSYAVLRRLPGARGGGVFAKPDKYDFVGQTPSRNGSRFNRNEQWWLGAFRGFTGRGPEGPFRAPNPKLPWHEQLTGGTGRRTLSGAEADRRWTQATSARGKIGVELNYNWMQSTSGGIRRSEPGFFTVRKIDTTVLKGKYNNRKKKR